MLTMFRCVGKTQSLKPRRTADGSIVDVTVSTGWLPWWSSSRSSSSSTPVWSWSRRRRTTSVCLWSSAKPAAGSTRRTRRATSSSSSRSSSTSWRPWSTSWVFRFSPIDICCLRSEPANEDADTNFVGLLIWVFWLCSGSGFYFHVWCFWFFLEEVRNLQLSEPLTQTSWDIKGLMMYREEVWLLYTDSGYQQ